MVKTKQIADKIKRNALSGTPILFFGRPGVGKTQAIERYGRQNYKVYIHMDGSQMGYEAIQGINYIAKDSIDEKGVTKHTETMKTASYPAIKELENYFTENPESDGSEVFVFIDEVSSFEQDDQRTMLNIINERKSPTGIKFGSNTTFVLAANPASDQRGFSNANAEAAVNLVEQAIVTRCAVYVVDYEVEDYIEYGIESGVNAVIIETLKENRNIFETYKRDECDEFQVAVPRTLSNLSKLLDWASENNEKLTMEDFSAYVGSQDSAPFYDVYDKLQKNWVDFEKLLDGDKKAYNAFKALEKTYKSIIVLSGIRNALRNNFRVDLPGRDKILREVLDDIGAEYQKIIAKEQVKEEALKTVTDEDGNTRANWEYGPEVSEWLCAYASEFN